MRDHLIRNKPEVFALVLTSDLLLEVMLKDLPIRLILGLKQEALEENHPLRKDRTKRTSGAVGTY